MKLLPRVLLIALSLVASFEATAINDHHQILEHFKSAKKFLCAREICPQKIPTIYFEEKEGYLGFTNHDNSRISISPESDAFKTQLTLVHEIVHVYRKQFNSEEEQWLEEGLAKLVEIQFSTLWPVSYTERLRKNPTLYFGSVGPDGKNNYGPGGEGYSSSFYLMLYLYKHFGQEDLLKKILTSPKSGWDNVINAINEIRQEERFNLPVELVSKESILRHFAVSLWINNMYTAKYALFQLDSRYEALASLSKVQFAPVQNTTDASVKIQFSNKYQTTNAQKVYSILSYEPFVIKEADPADKAFIFIYLFY